MLKNYKYKLKILANLPSKVIFCPPSPSRQGLCIFLVWTGVFANFESSFVCDTAFVKKKSARVWFISKKKKNSKLSPKYKLPESRHSSSSSKIFFTAEFECPLFWHTSHSWKCQHWNKFSWGCVKIHETLTTLILAHHV